MTRASVRLKSGKRVERRSGARHKRLCATLDRTTNKKSHTSVWPSSAPTADANMDGMGCISWGR